MKRQGPSESDFSTQIQLRRQSCVFAAFWLLAAEMLYFCNVLAHETANTQRFYSGLALETAHGPMSRILIDYEIWAHIEGLRDY